MSGQKSHAGTIIAKNGDLEVLNCLGCGYAHLLPLPDVGNYYADDQFYASHSPPDWFETVRQEHEAGLWDAAYRHQSRLLGDAWNVVDWGCGAGWFVHHWYGQRRGVPIGIEPSEKARREAPIPSLLWPSLEEAKRVYHLPLPRSAARASLVLEHLPDPVRFLRTMAENATGRVLVVVPNEFNPLQRRAGGNWFVSGVHCNYFTPSGLCNAMARAGLRVVHRGATFPMEVFIMMGLDYRGNAALGHKCFTARLRFEKALGGLAFRLYGLLHRRLGWGRELVYVGEQA